MHTAVKISPNYHRGQAVYVLDASRAVGVVSKLLSPTEKPPFIAATRADYEKVRKHTSPMKPARQRITLTRCTR